MLTFELIQRYNQKFLTCKELQRIVAQTIDGKWCPCYPESQNYPIRGKWFSSHRMAQPDMMTAVKIAIRPGENAGPDAVSSATAYRRAQTLLDPLRQGAAIGLIESNQYIVTNRR